MGWLAFLVDSVYLDDLEAPSPTTTNTTTTTKLAFFTAFFYLSNFSI